MNETLTFASERSPTESEPMAPWKVVIVDDDEEVHAITTLALRNFRFDGRPLTFLHSYSADEGEAVIRDNPDTALCLLDVVMETDHAGLDLAEVIRTRLNNTFTRIVLRTGQPGQAPEETIIADYDINDYKEKTELTRSKLHTLLYSCLRSYRDIIALDRSRQGLERILSASIHLQQKTFLTDFALGILEQISAILSPDEDALYAQCEGIAAHEQSGKLMVVAGTGAYHNKVGVPVTQLLTDRVRNFIDSTELGYHSRYMDNGYLCLYRSNELHLSMLFLKGLTPQSPIERHLLEVFCQNALTAFENLALRTELEDSQREIVFILGDAVEHRSRETGQHLRRVSHISELIALKAGLNEQQAQLIREAAPLHDLGKIGIPDQVLNKPGPLDEPEWDVMKTHSQIGYDLLHQSEKSILRIGALIALDHHERWDGTGYPNRKQGDEISIEGRIAALADVIDALTSERCYKQPWSFDDTRALIEQERGRQFDPALVDVVLTHFDEVIAIKNRYPD
ncbi:DUF3369 domain-containing protein [Saccharospirillum impatiens]|uniref:DUF3369 domain-containing protein n=1 Tax=Saccharospirillum impatiens TaxID=169438 RepID=UPI0003F9496F|nr:DUF3369 domain-containing protein [Saccharospirillum impatiens]